MKSEKVEEKIISVLNRYPDGLPIREIAKLMGTHRHTITKYIYELKGADVIRIRNIASAKLCILNTEKSRRK